MKVLQVLGIVPVLSGFFAPRIPNEIIEAIDKAEEIARSSGSKVVLKTHLSIAIMELEFKYGKDTLRDRFSIKTKEDLNNLKKELLGKNKKRWRGKVTFSQEAKRPFQDPESNISSLEGLAQSFIADFYTFIRE